MGQPDRVVTDPWACPSNRRNPHTGGVYITWGFAPCLWCGRQLVYHPIYRRWRIPDLIIREEPW